MKQTTTKAKAQSAAKKKASAKKSTANARKSATAATRTAAPSKHGGNSKDTEVWNLRLYVAGQTPKSVQAFNNLKKICEEHLQGKYTIEVIDLLEKPQLARGDQIVAIPTLVRKLPEPMKKIIGDLSNTERTLVGLDLRVAGTQKQAPL